MGSEAGRWYYPDGELCEVLLTQKGKEKKPNLTDAKKLGLKPSVTSVIDILDKPGLNFWKLNSVLNRVKEGQLDGETMEEFIARCRAAPKEVGQETAEEGKRIHTALENHFRGEEFDEEYAPHVQSVTNFIASLDQKYNNLMWTPESVIVTDKYAGRVDLIGKGKNIVVVVDFKTKDFEDDKKILSHDDGNLMQLAAYSRAVTMTAIAPIYNVYISRTVPGLIRPVDRTDDLERGYQMFLHLLEFFNLSKGLNYE